MNRWTALSVLFTSALCATSSAMAQPALTIDITHDGDDVVATISGSVDLTGMTVNGTPSDKKTQISTNSTAGSEIYLSSSISEQKVLLWTGFTDAPPFPAAAADFWAGDGALSSLNGGQSTSSDGSFIGLTTGNSTISREPWLFLPEGYSSGDAIDFEIRWNDATVVDLNLKPGVYAWEAPDVAEPSDNVIVLTIEKPPAYAPTVTQFLPSYAVAGTTVQIDGSGFEQGVTAVDFVEYDSSDIVPAASFAEVSATQVEAVVPSDLPAGNYFLRVTTTGGLTGKSTNYFILRVEEQEPVGVEEQKPGQDSITATPAVPVPVNSLWSLALLILTFALAGGWMVRGNQGQA